MQPDLGITDAQFLAAGQQPLMKLESYVLGKWVDYTNLPMEALIDGELEHWSAPQNLEYWTEDDGGTIDEGIYQESTIVHSLAYSAELRTIENGQWAALYQDITLTVGTNYTISLWYLKGAHVSSELMLFITDPDPAPNIYLKADGSGWQAAPTHIDLTTSAIWKYFSLAFTPHPDYTNYRVRFYKNHPSGGPVSYYVDDVSVSETVGKNYLESVSVSLGGATMTPQPVAGKWSASLFNADGVFHPQNPDLFFQDHLKTERLFRLSIGATYDGTPYYWQRIIGYLDVPKFGAGDFKVILRGGDYMKRLRDRELRLPDDNYWGDQWATTTLASDGEEGNELYTEGDAMDVVADDASIGGNWATNNCDFADAAPGGAPSTNVGSVTNITDQQSGVRNEHVFTAPAAGVQYKVTFQHRNVNREGARLRVRIDQDAGRITYVDFRPSNVWAEGTFNFTTLDNTDVQIIFRLNPGFTEFQLDLLSFYRFISYEDRYYDLQDYDGDQKGPYHVTIDRGLGDGPESVWQGEGDEGWWYEEATGHVFFDINKVVEPGLDMVIYYFKTEVGMENVVTDLLVKAGITDALDSDPTGIDIDKVWFEPGTNCLDAIKKICERCNYKFYFEWDGTPIFKPQAAVGVTQISFNDPKYMTSIFTYQDRNEIKNRIVIKGMKQAEPVNRDQTMPPELEGELSDAASIAAYGERTLTIDNHLFQTQDSIDHAVTGMCKILLDEYKDPKWYSDLKLDFHPAPLMIGDTIEWKERLSPTTNIDQKGIIRDIKISNFNTVYKCVLVP